MDALSYVFPRKTMPYSKHRDALRQAQGCPKLRISKENYYYYYSYYHYY